MRDVDKEAQLSQALLSDNPVTDMPIAVEVDYFRLEKDKYFAPDFREDSGLRLWPSTAKARNRRPSSISSPKSSMPGIGLPQPFATPFR